MATSYIYRVETTCGYGSPGVQKFGSLEAARVAYDKCVLENPKERCILLRNTLENGREVLGYDIVLSAHTPKIDSSCVVV